MCIWTRTVLAMVGLFVITPDSAEAIGRRSRGQPRLVVTYSSAPATTIYTTYSPVASLGAPVAIAYQSDSAFKNDMTICGNQPIPDGWVLVGHTTVFSCGGTGNNNAMILRRLPTASGSQMTICGNQPIPTGWVLAGHTTVFSYGGTGNNNAMIIRKL
jgi:hypothetical protein